MLFPWRQSRKTCVVQTRFVGASRQKSSQDTRLDAADARTKKAGEKSKNSAPKWSWSLDNRGPYKG